MIWIVIVALVVGTAAGAIIMRIIFKKKAVGTLRIDKSDPEVGPLLFLELSEPVEKLEAETLVAMNVVVENLIVPQEKHSL